MRLGENGEDAEQRRMRAGRHENSFLRRHQCAPAKPARRGVLVGLGAAKTLVAQQRNDIARHEFHARLHALDQVGIDGLRRQVHRQVDRARRRHRLSAARTGFFTNEGALPDLGFDQAAFLRLDIAARHRGEIDIEAFGELALRRQPIADRQSAGADIDGESVGNRQIARLVAAR